MEFANRFHKPGGNKALYTNQSCTLVCTIFSLILLLVRMKVFRRISIGGWIFLTHFACVAVVFSLPIVLPQPQASITSGDHWYWGFLQSTERLFFWLTLPVSCFMYHPRDSAVVVPAADYR